MLLTLKNLSFSYLQPRFLRKREEKIIFSHLDFSIDSNERVGLMGQSGCGKSTLARIIAGLMRQSSGEIYLNDKPVDLTHLVQKRAFYTQVQILFQDPISSLNPRLNLMQNLIEPLVYLFSIRDRDTQLERILPLLDNLGLDSTILHSYPPMVSGGEAQRICLARTLLVKPKLLILDEATSNLDYLLSLRILGFLKQWQDTNSCAFLFITHNSNFARQFCQRVLVMQEGNIKEMG